MTSNDDYLPAGTLARPRQIEGDLAVLQGLSWLAFWGLCLLIVSVTLVGPLTAAAGSGWWSGAICIALAAVAAVPPAAWLGRLVSIAVFGKN